MDHRKVPLIVSRSGDDQTKFIINKPRLRGHHKSRSGCFTCKKRKIRCSEEKPKCGNCLKRNLSCRYSAGKESIESCLVDTSFTTTERQLIDHFAHHFGDPNNVFYHSELSGPWLLNITARALHHPQLCSAIISCASSHISYLTGAALSSLCFQHRSQALAWLSSTSLHQPQHRRKQDTLLATCLVLRFQSFFLDDGFHEWLALKRLTMSLTRWRFDDLNIPAAENASTMNRENMHGNKFVQHKEAPELDERIGCSAVASLKLLDPHVTLESVRSKLHRILETCATEFQSNTVLGMRSFEVVYLELMHMSEAELRSLTHNDDPVPKILLAHFVALLSLTTVLTWFRAADQQSRPMGKVARWIENLVGDLENDATWRNHVRWPLLVSRAEQDVACLGRHSIRDYHTLLVEAPGVFCFPVEHTRQTYIPPLNHGY